jgi:hypothetical protein
VGNSNRRLPGASDRKSAEGFACDRFWGIFNDRMPKLLKAPRNNSLLLFGILVLAGCATQQPSSSSPGVRDLSIEPRSGAGRNQIFRAVYSHPEGSSQIGNARVLFNSVVDGRKACYVFYDRASTSVLLVHDSGNGTTRAAMGDSGRLTNSQCELDASVSSASDAAKTLTLNLGITFKETFAGEKNVYLYAEDNQGHSSGFQQRGIWTVP